MSFIERLKSLFKSKPSLEEFVALHNPTDIYQVERLEQLYWQHINQMKFKY
jgi:hypothetical protein